MSLTLSLVRHAKSAWDDPELEDFERPLNARGRRDAPRMAQLAATQCAQVPILLSSPAVRAITTARRFAEAFDIDARTMRIDARLYEASAGDWCEVLQSQPDDGKALMAFGHNPGISAFAAWLCPDMRGVEMPTAALLILELECQRWAELAPDCARRIAYHRPRDVEA
ncbi:SixA phosphatase family protein [Algiphilus sp.]|uniref:SixA phosphatase family protein n=1 Tax=Algiphilus sp. TaxID=1872431 RepID=UPI003B5189D6